MKSVGIALTLSTLALSQTAMAEDAALKAKAEVVLQKSCGACHDQSMDAAFVDDSGAVIWDNVKLFAEKIVARVSATTRPMPPARAPAALQINATEKADLIAYSKSLLATNPVEPVEPEIVPLSKLKLDPGFKIEVFAQAQGARSLTVHSSGIVFVGTGGFSNVDPQGRVYAIVPQADGKRKVVAIAKGLDNPNGVAVEGNDLYIAEQARVIKIANATTIAGQLAAGTPVRVAFSVVKDDFRQQGNHSWKYLTVGPDKKLYVPIGADCNVCKEDEGASIYRMNLDGSDFERVAQGVRNTVGITFHPETGDMWFTDNGRDSMGDNLPADELNVIPAANIAAGQSHFGFPYCFATTVKDPTFGRNVDCDAATFSKPYQDLGAHVASLGMDFYTGTQFPAKYQGQIFVAEHGSWNSSKKVGYRLTTVETVVGLDGKVTKTYRPFVSGFADDKTNWGRPVDVKNYVDGSLLLSDDAAGIVYRISYSAN